MSLMHTQGFRLLNPRLKRQRRQKRLDKLTMVVGNMLLKAAYGSWNDGSPQQKAWPESQFCVQGEDGKVQTLPVVAQYSGKSTVSISHDFGGRPRDSFDRRG